MDPAQQMAFRVFLPLLFCMLTRVHEVLYMALRVNIYPLYFFGLPAYAGLVLAGGVQRALRERPVLYWTAFCAWAVLAVPFSSWRGDSAAMLFYYLKTTFPLLLLVAGLTVSWRQCRVMMYAIAASAAAFVLLARAITAVDASGRAGMEFGELANANDLAAVLILLLPFLLWYAFSSGWVVLRVAALAVAFTGLYQTVHTGSRGALVALAVALLFYLWRATLPQRVGALFVAPLAAALLLALIPPAALQRIVSFSRPGTTHDALDEGAMESTATRKLLLQKSIEYTLRFPLFGVGPGQFVNYEGRNDVLPGLRHGMWRVTHNAYTQVSSECGIPAFVFFTAAIVASFRLLNRVYRQARERPGCQDISTAAFCIMLSMAGFCTAIMFLSLAYTVYLPVMSGLAVAIARAAPEEFRLRAATDHSAPGPSLAVPAWRLARP